MLEPAAQWFGPAPSQSGGGGVSASMSRLVMEAEGGDGTEDFKVTQ